MIGLAISYRPFNISLRIQGLQFSSAPWSNTPRKNFAVFSTPFYEACERSHFMKYAKQVITSSTRACKAHENAKHVRLAKRAKHVITQAHYLADFADPLQPSVPYLYP